jgi:arginine repressor
MARPKSNEGPNKSDVVREYLKSHSSASVSQIVEDLKSHGITASLAQKIKYKDGAKRGRRVRKARGAEAAGAAGEPSKADHIRRVAGGMGKRVRPRDVIASLASEGITVSYAQVGHVLKGLGMRRRGRGKGGRRRTGARTGGPRRAGRAAAASGAEISLDALIAAKKLADALGGVQAAKQAMDALARLS